MSEKLCKTFLSTIAEGGARGYFGIPPERKREAHILGQQRRSKRLPISIPVRVYGRTPDDQPFRDITETESVSSNGGLIPLTRNVKQGQTLLLVNGITDEERQCRVVYIERRQRTGKQVAVEFTDAKGDFWHVFAPIVNRKREVDGD
jgi:hypothetical protein